MKIIFFDALTMGDTSLDAIAAQGDFTSYPYSSREEALSRAADCDVAIVNKIVVDEEFLAHAPKLKLVCEAGTGINNIDVDACSKRGIPVRNVAAYSTDSVAQTTIMHILNLVGHAFYQDNYVRSGEYSRGHIHTNPKNPFMELTGKPLGVIGMGAIGQRVAKIALAFGMDVIYYSTSGTSHCHDYPSVPLEELLRRSDVVTIHAPYNERTAGLVGDKELAMMKPTAVLVNTGRGGIAREDALARAIDNGTIAGVGLDVYEKEPLPLDSPLLHTKYPDRITFTPHVAWVSHEALRRLADAMAENIAKGW